MATPHSYILLRNESREYPRGRFLELNEDGSYEWHSLALGGFKSPKTIRCDNDGDVAPLSEVEYYLLDGIDSDADRYEVYITPGKLEWGRSLKVGDSVLARLPLQHKYTTAIIRWCGGMDLIGGVRYKIGVEIMVSTKARNS